MTIRLNRREFSQLFGALALQCSSSGKGTGC